MHTKSTNFSEPKQSDIRGLLVEQPRKVSSKLT